MQRKEVEEIKKTYKRGMRLRMTKDMIDRYGQGLPEGSSGIVTGVDDVGTIHMRWDCGSTLGIAPDVDQFEVIPHDTGNLGWRITDFGRQMDMADDLIEFISENGGSEGREILKRMSEIKEKLRKELNTSVRRLLMAVDQKTVNRVSDEEYAEMLVRKFDDGEYKFVGAIVVYLEKEANKN